MRKRIITTDQQAPKALPSEQQCLNIEALAEVEITSEVADHPIEFALLPGHHSGWRAAEPGKQTIRLIFSNPQVLKRIYLHFIETTIERSQEYTLRWSADNGQSFQEIARQQWNFSPDGANSEIEEHHVALSGVTLLELTIIPDISSRNSYATLNKLRLA